MSARLLCISGTCSPALILYALHIARALGCMSPSIRLSAWTPTERRAVCVIKAAQAWREGRRESRLGRRVGRVYIESMRRPTLHEPREANADKKLFCALPMVFKVGIVCVCDHTVCCKHYAN